MARTSKRAQRGGWRHQAEQLAFSHTAVATVAVAAADQALQRRHSKPVSCHFPAPKSAIERISEATEIELPNEPVSTRAAFGDLEQRAARERAERRTLNARRETLAARALRARSAEKRIIELEGELCSTREELAVWKNSNHSLQASLDLVSRENSRLSLAAADVIEGIKAKLTAAETEHDSLVLALDEENKKQRMEIDRLNTLLSAADSERLKLNDDTNKLLKTCKMRDRALARAEDRISMLTKLFSQLEAIANSPKLLEKIDQSNIELQRKRTTRSVNQGARKKKRQECTVLQRHLDSDDWLLAGTDPL